MRGTEIKAIMIAPAIGIPGFTMVLEYIAIDPPMDMKSAIVSNPIKKYLAALTDFFMILVILYYEVTKRVYFIGNERMLIAHDSNRLRFS